LKKDNRAIPRKAKGKAVSGRADHGIESSG
jgi:hypothetical protein